MQVMADRNCETKRINLTSKEKRLIRKERTKLLAAAWDVVNKANEIINPLAKFAAFSQFRRESKGNGVLDLAISSMPVSDVDDETFEQIFRLERDNMKDLYENCAWGWHEKKKRAEMRDDRARYLIAKDSVGNVQAFSHYRFDIDFDVPVLYCYELQLLPKVRRLGLGKFMLQTLELIAFTNDMRKVVLTVFKNNSDACRFFEKLRYEVDETSPEYDENDDDSDDSCHYIIMSKQNKKYITSKVEAVTPKPGNDCA